MAIEHLVRKRVDVAIVVDVVLADGDGEERSAIWLWSDAVEERPSARDFGNNIVVIGGVNALIKRADSSRIRDTAIRLHTLGSLAPSFPRFTGAVRPPSTIYHRTSLAER